ncbi:uncharacterized protein VP01_1835g2 [Puccinia sorghi]|uniref:Uncharacterized protein n=1 Tax=Puccinia sorghi TaxID=27349 RepID=A0A0L6VFP2_9BASI|nr:uncharacterized protein VP01_1835g2 [Puccinia sorghi]
MAGIWASLRHQTKGNIQEKGRGMGPRRDGGRSSIKVVLDWISEGTNYLRWRGDVENGKTKKSLCSEVLQLMIYNGINHCDVRGITQKINDLQSSYNTASNWKSNTRAGILENNTINGVKTVKGVLQTRSMHFVDTGTSLIPSWDHGRSPNPYSLGLPSRQTRSIKTQIIQAACLPMTTLTLQAAVGTNPPLQPKTTIKTIWKQQHPCLWSDSYNVKPCPQKSKQQKEKKEDLAIQRARETAKERNQK